MSARLSVRRTPEVDHSLAVLTSAGWTVSDAVRYALALLSDAHESAWDVGAASVGQAVDVVRVNVVPRQAEVSDAA